jgi:hypothetical protein
VLGNVQVGVYDNFFGIGGDSLSGALTALRISAMHNIDLPVTFIFQNPTISEQAGAINRILVEKVNPLLYQEQSALVALQSNGSKLPFFCLPINLGNVFANLGDLAKILGRDQPFYSLQDGLHNPSDIHSIAAQYIDEIRSVQPQGPFQIGGFCSGGVVALEMAQQLYSLGQKVALLAMIEPSIPHNPGLATYLNFFVKILLRFFKRFRHHTQKVNQLDSDLQSNYLRLKFKVFFSNALALRRYKPKPYPGYLHLFLSEETNSKADIPQMGWLDFAEGGSQVHIFSGTNHTVTGHLDTPIDILHVQALAEELKPYLDNEI